MALYSLVVSDVPLRIYSLIVCQYQLSDCLRRLGVLYIALLHTTHAVIQFLQLQSGF